jgi:hypothetical protein
LSANGFPGLSERENAGRLLGLPSIFQQDDGGFGVDLDGPTYPTRAFAEAVALAGAVSP